MSARPLDRTEATSYLTATCTARRTLAKRDKGASRTRGRPASDLAPVGPGGLKPFQARAACSAIVRPLRQRLSVPLQPELFKQEPAKAEAVIEFAAKVKDWPLLHNAIDQKIADQTEFVRWWDENVSVRHGRDWGKNADRGSLSKDTAEQRTGVSQQQVSRWRTWLADSQKYRERVFLAACRKAGLVPAENHRAEGSGENEWFTPPEYIQAAYAVLGAIDLDPASHPKAQKWIKATNAFTKAENGLSQEWHGRVWLNPPYTQPDIANFVSKLVGEYLADRVTAEILLTHNYTDTAWFHEAAAKSTAICFTRGRVKFIDETGDTCAPNQGQAFFYYGDDPGRFLGVFKPFGLVMARI